MLSKIEAHRRGRKIASDLTTWKQGERNGVGDTQRKLGTVAVQQLACCTGLHVWATPLGG